MRLMITDAEWEVMRVVWAQKKTTSRQISDVLMEKMDWKVATIKTLLSRLVEKGYLKTEQVGNKFIYSAAVSEETSVEHASQHLLAHVCAKKVGATLAMLIQDATLSTTDVVELTKLLQKKETVAEVACNCTPGQCNCSHSESKMNQEERWHA